MKIDAEFSVPSLVHSRSRVLDYLELMKPELTGLSVLTALCGFYLGSQDALKFWVFVATALGTLLVGGGAGALNQYLERDYAVRVKDRKD